MLIAVVGALEFFFEFYAFETANQDTTTKPKTKNHKSKTKIQKPKTKKQKTKNIAICANSN